MQARADRDGGRRGRGVSHVVGVVLLVAIVTLLVGVVAVFATGFEGDLEEPAPSFSTTTTYDDRWSGNGQYLNITHKGGETVHTDQVYMDVDGARSVNPPGGSPQPAELRPDVIEDQVGAEFTASETIVLNRTSFTDAGGPLTGSRQVDLDDAVVRIVYDPGPDKKSVTIYECRPAVPDCEQTPA